MSNYCTRFRLLGPTVIHLLLTVHIMGVVCLQQIAQTIKCICWNVLVITVVTGIQWIATKKDAKIITEFQCMSFSIKLERCVQDTTKGLQGFSCSNM